MRFETHSRQPSSLHGHHWQRHRQAAWTSSSARTQLRTRLPPSHRTFLFGEKCEKKTFKLFLRGIQRGSCSTSTRTFQLSMRKTWSTTKHGNIHHLFPNSPKNRSPRNMYALPYGNTHHLFHTTPRNRRHSYVSFMRKTENFSGLLHNWSRNVPEIIKLARSPQFAVESGPTQHPPNSGQARRQHHQQSVDAC